MLLLMVDPSKASRLSPGSFDAHRQTGRRGVLIIAKVIAVLQIALIH